MKEAECKKCGMHYVLDENCTKVPESLTCTCESKSFVLVEA